MQSSDHTAPSRPDTAGHSYGLADLHAHTAHGDGMADARAVLERIEAHTNLDIVAITDHDDIRGALIAREVHAHGRYRFELVTGIEVTTRSGHLLALWVDRPIPSFRSLEETIATIHDAGGLAVLAHPFSPLTRSVGQRGLERVLRIADPSTHPDGIEVANLTLAGRVTGAKPRRLNVGYGLAETGGSDAHFPEELGMAATAFPGRTSADLRTAILARQTRGLAGQQVPLRQIGVRRLARQQARGLAVTPRKVLGPPLARLLRRAGAVRA